VGPQVRLIDSGAEAALATAGLLRRRGLLAGGDAAPQHRFYLSDQRLDFERVARAFLGRELPPTAIVDQTDLPWFERSIRIEPRRPRPREESLVTRCPGPQPRAPHPPRSVPTGAARARCARSRSSAAPCPPPRARPS